MSRCLYLTFSALVLSGLLGAGCRTVPANSGALDGESAAQVGAFREGKRAEASNLDHRAKAHAHYAAAVIHDINGERDQALEEYLGRQGKP